MDNRPVIMVQTAEPEWTSGVLHAACRLARACSGEIVLVQMVRARHLSYLGSELGYLDISEDEKRNLELCEDTVEDYGLPCHVTLYQHCGLYEAILGAAELVGASVIYAKLPRSAIPFWSDCQFELLRVRLSRQHIELFNEPGIWAKLAPVRVARQRYADAHAWEHRYE